jgi:hypothetical protein
MIFHFKRVWAMSKALSTLPQRLGMGSGAGFIFHAKNAEDAKGKWLPEESRGSRKMCEFLAFFA